MDSLPHDVLFILFLVLLVFVVVDNMFLLNSEVDNGCIYMYLHTEQDTIEH